MLAATWLWRYHATDGNAHRSPRAAWLCLAAGLPALAPAADLLSEQDVYADIPLVISATRLAQSQPDAPATVTVIDRAMIEASGAVELADLLRLVPGFQVAHVLGNTFAVTSHGFATERPGHLQVLVDGRSVFVPLFSKVDWANLPVEMEDIERIEVTRGPNTPTYGGNAFRGVINIITRQPFEVRGRFAQAAAGSQNMGYGLARYADDSGSGGYRLSVSYRRDEGFDQVDDRRRVAKASLRTSVVRARDSFDIQLGYAEGANGDDGDGSALNPVRDRDVRDHFQYLRWTLRRSVDSELYLQAYHNDYRENDRYLLGPLSAALGVNPADVPAIFGGQPDQSIPYGYNDGAGERYDLEFQHTMRPQPGLGLVWGAGLRRDIYESSPFWTENGGSHRDDSVRLFGNVEWRPTPSVVTNLGAMLEHHDLGGTRLSPRAAANWHVAPQHTLRAGVTRAYRVPSLFEEHLYRTARFNDGSIIDIVDVSASDLDPEEITAYELGYHLARPEAGLALDARLYRERLRDLITEYDDETYPEPWGHLGRPLSGVFVWHNNGYLDIDGLEIEADYRPDRKTLLRLAYANAQAEGRYLRRVFAGGGVEYQDLSTAVPRHTVSLLAARRFGPWALSAAFYRTSTMDWQGVGDTLQHKRLDLRLARKLRLDGADVTLELLAHNVTGEYIEFDEENRFDRRYYVRVSVAF